MESIEEAGIHFEVTRQVGGEAESAFAVRFAVGVEKEAFGESEGIGGKAISGGSDTVGFGGIDGREEKARIALFEGEEGRDGLREVGRGREGESAGEGTPGALGVAEGEGSLRKWDEGEGAGAIGEENRF